MQSQDFSKKMVVVVRNDLPSWQVLNTVAHISAYLGNKMESPFDTGAYFVSKDGVNHPRNSQYPIMVFCCKPGQLQDLFDQVRNSGILHIAFFREMIETNVDQEIVEALQDKTSKDLEHLGVGIFGTKEEVGKYAKKFSLWK